MLCHIQYVLAYIESYHWLVIFKSLELWFSHVGLIWFFNCVDPVGCHQVSRQEHSLDCRHHYYVGSQYQSALVLHLILMMRHRVFDILKSKFYFRVQRTRCHPVWHQLALDFQLAFSSHFGEGILAFHHPLVTSHRIHVNSCNVCLSCLSWLVFHTICRRQYMHYKSNKHELTKE